jgi:hypothetical protein
MISLKASPHYGTYAAGSPSLYYPAAAVKIHVEQPISKQGVPTPKYSAPSNSSGCSSFVYRDRASQLSL